MTFNEFVEENNIPADVRGLCMAAWTASQQLPELIAARQTLHLAGYKFDGKVWVLPPMEFTFQPTVQCAQSATGNHMWCDYEHNGSTVTRCCNCNADSVVYGGKQ